MKRKYYMRGLGLGILVTAILCAVALPKKTVPMTDEEVIARAQELGYVIATGGVTAEDIDKIKEKVSGTPGVTEDPEGTLAVTDEPEGTPGPIPSPVPTPEPPEEPDKPELPATPTSKPTATPKPTSTPKPTATAAPTETPKATDTPVSTNLPEKSSYTIKVERGATARRVAEQLEAAGAVEDANGFVKYLQSRKLTDFINIGTFKIPQGASYAEITKILTDR